MMKNLKLKYCLIALVFAIQWSCKVTDIGKEIEESVVSKGEFIFEPGITYSINGVITFDHKLIEETSKTAWMAHYDYPNFEVNFSTTEKDFEKYKESHAEYKAQLTENHRLAVENASKEVESNEVVISEENFNNSASRVAAYDDYTNFDSRDYSNKSTIILDYKFAGSSPFEALFIFPATSDSNLTVEGVRTNFTSKSNTFTPIAVAPIISDDTKYPNVFLSMRNASTSISLTKTFSKSGATGISVTVGKNSVKMMPNVETFDPTSFQ